jgi:hypothetical protein
MMKIIKRSHEIVFGYFQEYLINSVGMPSEQRFIMLLFLRKNIVLNLEYCFPYLLFFKGSSKYLIFSFADFSYIIAYDIHCKIILLRFAE